MPNFAQSLYDSIPGLVGGAVTGLCVVGAAIITSKSITRLDKVSHKRKILSALEAEILGYASKSRNFNRGDSLLGFYEKVHSEQEHEILLPSELNNLVYKSLVQNLHVLPEDVVKPVVGFYNAMYSIEFVLDAINNPKFAKMGIPRKVEIFYDYVDLKGTALILAEQALEEIKKAKG